MFPAAGSDAKRIQCHACSPSTVAICQHARSRAEWATNTGVAATRAHNTSSQVSPTRSWPKLWCSSAATSVNPAFS